MQALANKKWSPDGAAETRYKKARQEWDTRMGHAVVQARNWRLATLLSLGLVLVSLVGTIYLGAQPKAVPHIVQVDRLRLTSIQLQPGERIVGKPAAGDTIRWLMGVGRSGADAGQQEHLFVKPTRAGLDTTMAITTDRRTYYLELHSFEDTYMAAVQWRYPHDELAELDGAAARDEALARATTATNVNVEALNFSYRVTVVKGKPVWAPVQVFDDGSKTFVRFPRAMLNREAPALFVLSSTDEAQLVNYRMKNDTYVVDRLIERAELRVGQKDQEIVQISRAR
jgi:P-type conjugative transfer protein TrbG